MRERIIRFFNQLFCSHKNTTLIDVDYQDQRYIFKCNDCGKEIVSDL
jgi:transcription elongation factor Elf1